MPDDIVDDSVRIRKARTRGAHGCIERLTLLTRDARHYRAYFPKLRIIAP